MENPPPPPPPRVLAVSFNEDGSRLVAGLSNGFCVYKFDPFSQVCRRDIEGGVRLISVNFDAQLTALVGVSKPAEVCVRNYDAGTGRCVWALELPSEVKAIKLLKTKIVIAQVLSVSLYDLGDSRRMELKVDTVPNPRGICEVSVGSSSVILAFPGNQTGEVRLETYGTDRPRFIAAHKSELACVAVTGSIIATASCKGTLIRVFDTVSGNPLKEVRRGMDTAEIYNLVISRDGQWLALCSANGTVHVFDVSPGLKGVASKYFKERSTAVFRLPAGSEGLPHTVAFGGGSNTILIAGANGSFYQCIREGGRITQIEDDSFSRCVFDPDDGVTNPMEQYAYIDGRDAYSFCRYPRKI